MVLKGAIIGFGHIAANGHVPAYKNCSDVEIYAVCDSCVERRSINERLLNGSRFYTSIQELFDKEPVDFVDVATPPAMHSGFILEALSRKKHVLCEKPLVLGSKELVQIREKIEESHCQVVTVHNWRYSPIMQEISRVVRGGRLGKPLEVEYLVTRVKPSIAVSSGDDENNWRLDPKVAGGGILVDHGWHAFYLVNEWVGEQPVALECRLENRKFHQIPVEDTAEVLLIYPSGARARLFFTWAGKRRENVVKIRGELGSLICPDRSIQVENGSGSCSVKFEEALSEGSHHPDWYSGVLEEFLREVREESFAGRNFKEAASCLNILEHCKKAHKQGRRVDILPIFQEN